MANPIGLTWKTWWEAEAEKQEFPNVVARDIEDHGGVLVDSPWAKNPTDTNEFIYTDEQHDLCYNDVKAGTYYLMDVLEQEGITFSGRAHQSESFPGAPGIQFDNGGTYWVLRSQSGWDDFMSYIHG